MIHYMILFIMGVGVQGIWLLWLKKRSLYQPIYELSPGAHQKKASTPSFGGVGIMITVWLGVAFFELWEPRVIWIMGLVTCSAILGGYDDWVSVKKDRNKGLGAREKFVLQIIIASVFMYIYSQWILPVSIIQGVFYVFVMVGSMNATNLSDGLDGLLSGLGIVSLIGFVLLCSQLGFKAGAQLSIVAMISLACFLVYNRYPARIFMGDTGSLAIGALLSGLAVSVSNIWVLISLGGVYVIETLSVMIQVVSYKKRQKRVYLMSPLHHHFELLGWKEPIVSAFFWGIGAVFLWIFKMGYIG